jgi:hypothetical protein
MLQFFELYFINLNLISGSGATVLFTLSTCEGLDLFVLKVVLSEKHLDARFHAEGAQQQHLNE